MSTERDKTGIFLSIVIVFLIVAMGVYGFIYRDKLNEFFQKFQKKNEEVEKHTIYNNNSLADKNQPASEKIEEPNPNKNSLLKNIPLETKDSPKSEIETMNNENVPGDDIPKTSKTKKQSRVDFKGNLPDNDLSKTTSPDKQVKLEFVKNTRGKTKYKRNKKRKYSNMRKRKTTSLLSRVSRLERALGVKSSKKLSIEKRIEFLEKKLKAKSGRNTSKSSKD